MRGQGVSSGGSAWWGKKYPQAAARTGDAPVLGQTALEQQTNARVKDEAFQFHMLADDCELMKGASPFTEQTCKTPPEPTHSG
jgi:hypothetical protein